MTVNKYIHLRRFDQNGGTSSFGGLTIGFRTDVEMQCIVYTIAKVHPNDRYNKKRGRELVDERLRSGTDYRVLTVQEVLDECRMCAKINSNGLSKLKIEDFNWKVIVSAISHVVQDASNYDDYGFYD